jgi:hypothetical protein
MAMIFPHAKCECKKCKEVDTSLTCILCRYLRAHLSCHSSRRVNVLGRGCQQQAPYMFFTGGKIVMEERIAAEGLGLARAFCVTCSSRYARTIIWEVGLVNESFGF